MGRFWRGRVTKWAGGAGIFFSAMFVGAAAARAQDVVALRPPALAPSGAGLDDGVRSRADESWPERQAKTLPFEQHSILLELGTLHLPREAAASSLVSEVAPEDLEAPGTVVQAYHGIQAVLARRMLGYYHQMVNDEIRQMWEGSSLDSHDFDVAVADIFNHEADHAAGGRWWNRTWRQSLVPEKGGVPAQLRIEDVGHEIEVIRLGELAITTEGKLRVGRLSLYLDDDRIYERLKPLETLASAQPRARADAHLARGANVAGPNGPDSPTSKSQPPSIDNEDRIDLSIAVADDAEVELENTLRGTLRERFLNRVRGVPRGKTPRGNLWTGDGWNVSLRPSLQLRLPKGMSSLESTVALAGAQLDLALFPGELREPWAVVIFRVRGRPAQNDVMASVDFELLRW